MMMEVKGVKFGFKALLNSSFGLLLLLVGMWVQADAMVPAAREAATASKSITVVLSGDSGLYQRSLAALKRHLPTTMEVESLTLEQIASGERQLSANDFVVTVGAKAAEQVMATATEARQLSILLPSSTFYDLAKQYPQSAQRLDGGRLSAIFLDQPARRQLNLARLINPNLKAIGTLYDIRSQQLVQQLSEVAGGTDIEFRSRRLLPSDNPIAVLREMYRDIDVFLAVPGKYIFNRSTAKWMLYLSYRNRKPLLGFSEDYVTAGALAAVYSNPEQIAGEAGSWLQECLDSGKPLPPPSHPSIFSVSVNREVASRMGLGSLIAARLESQLKAQEQLP
ncbi:hypothetical protein HBA55_07565 [Pseudomaricurvus alkylphenolicus]|uniref:ABC transporter substrate-binding protein n=1 Tax=Pseudomaricurvus alkylphenolicus TaxID=1306991 RepID=UPI00142488BF|nr:ABC transporter substrate binding protein [Pseudomaricurvus alkylphenolicus]NIB39438.1 hypothetical protein [Pseudomaricurvus alkylphenolicus]